MKQAPQKELNVTKAARFAIIINAIQIAAMAAVLLYVLITGHAAQRYLEIGAICVAFLIVTWGAVLDIREALNARRIAEQARMLEDAYGQLESLNGTLRKQRHDFMNHLQVVFSLMEMREYDEAMRYVESVYGDIKQTGSVLRTAVPAINALIAAKRQDCADHGIQLEIAIESGWANMPVPGWEMCRVLGNLIDNARDALLESPDTPGKRIAIKFDETPGAFLFRVENNGPAIPPSLLEGIFRMGFTTKAEGHGSGLSIVRDILRRYGGGISVTSDAERTAFDGHIPKSAGGIAPEGKPE